ncbi:MAG: TIGR03943 family protein [Spirochaetaceae bacterium]|nr:MAG: TIGR03943 family protein [Spirochaetaceae bacterium]
MPCPRAASGVERHRRRTRKRYPLFAGLCVGRHRSDCSVDTANQRFCCRRAVVNTELLKRRLWAAILLGYFAAILVLALSGGLLRFVEPRAVRAIVLSAGVMAMLGVARLIGPVAPSGSPQHGFVVFLLPLVFVLIGTRYSGPPASAFLGVDRSALAAVGLGSDSQGISPAALQLGRPHNADSHAGTVPREISSVAEDPSIIDMQTVRFDEELFFRYYSLIYEQRDLFEGRSVVLRGFVGREPSFAAQRFYVARRLLWCCTLDASLLPLLVESDRGAVPREGQWVEIEAVVDATQISSDSGTQTVPLLRATAVREVEAPEFEYVFPF